jgi:type IV pilus assembly protein PilO
VKKQIPLWPVAVLGLMIVAAVVYFLLIGPKRSEAGRLAEEIASLETQVQTAKLASQPDEAGTQLKVAGLFELTKAMPDRDDMPGIILELNAIAEAAGVTFKTIAPQNPVVGTGYRSIPISLSFEGNYYDLTDFLFRMRNLVAVRDGKLASSGRFFTLDTIDMHEADLPRIEAVLVVSAYVYDEAAQAVAPVAPVTGTPVPPPTTTTAATSNAAAAGGLP